MLVNKIEITQKELDEMYEVTDKKTEVSPKEEEDEKFEIAIKQGDKQLEEELDW